jgi:hypothetical protein
MRPNGAFGFCSNQAGVREIVSWSSGGACPCCLRVPNAGARGPVVDDCWLAAAKRTCRKSGRLSEDPDTNQHAQLARCGSVRIACRIAQHFPLYFLRFR